MFLDTRESTLRIQWWETIGMTIYNHVAVSVNGIKSKFLFVFSARAPKTPKFLHFLSFLSSCSRSGYTLGVKYKAHGSLKYWFRNTKSANLLKLETRCSDMYCPVTLSTVEVQANLISQLPSKNPTSNIPKLLFDFDKCHFVQLYFRNHKHILMACHF